MAEYERASTELQNRRSCIDDLMNSLAMASCDMNRVNAEIEQQTEAALDVLRSDTTASYAYGTWEYEPPAAPRPIHIVSFIETVLQQQLNLMTVCAFVLIERPNGGGGGGDDDDEEHCDHDHGSHTSVQAAPRPVGTDRLYLATRLNEYSHQLVVFELRVLLTGKATQRVATATDAERVAVPCDDAKVEFADNPLAPLLSPSRLTDDRFAPTIVFVHAKRILESASRQATFATASAAVATASAAVTDNAGTRSTTKSTEAFAGIEVQWLDVWARLTGYFFAPDDWLPTDILLGTNHMARYQDG
jgi:hypothetical protein